MSTLLIVMIIAALGLAYWSAGRAAAERADLLGRDACSAAGVQWLDQTVHAAGLRLRRGDDGRIWFERSFRFEYSLYGADSSVGRNRGARRRSVVGMSAVATSSRSWSLLLISAAT